MSSRVQWECRHTQRKHVENKNMKKTMEIQENVSPGADKTGHVFHLRTLHLYRSWSLLAVVFPPRTLPPDPVILLRFLCLCLTIVTRFLFPASARNTRHCRYPATNADSEHLGRWILLSQSMSRTFLKPWFHVKIKLFWTLLVLYFNMEPHLKWNKIILVAEIIFLHFRHHVWNEVKLF